MVQYRVIYKSEYSDIINIAHAKDKEDAFEVKKYMESLSFVEYAYIETRIVTQWSRM